ncbi:effector-associated constant component EACC1 [Streptomyces kebangsaanensis]|uniref:effector-associated constant component EACC1 n=1 Tax=Streptomyces kebangsaanensis TaxID=864058 RepID=UPI000AE09373|nr:hypothetical protein [Streptomyces kebangsaanensis]
MEPSKLEVVPGLASLTDDHPAVLGAIGELTSMLRDEPDIVAESSFPAVSGAKGMLPSILVELVGSSVAVGAVVRVFRLWLQRDRRRSIRLRRTLPDGSVIEQEVSGVAISDQTLRAALEQLDGASTNPLSGS